MKISEIKEIKNEYRPIPFWSWNERLDAKETRRQVRVMKEAGVGGYFMHARGGLLTEYMGEEWFRNVDATIDEGKRLGMDTWAYDENGWPSGFGDGKVLMFGEDYHIKNLTYAKDEDYKGEERRVILRRDGYTYYYSVNELYVDLLNPAVTDAFIEAAYEPYRKRCGKDIVGFFTDEPQLLRVPGYPWSIITRDEFKKRYSYDLVDVIPSLFFEVGDYKKVRHDYWRMTTDLFSKNYFKRLYDWCERYGYKLTGHLVMEDVLEDIVPTNGSAMAHYEYFQVPGMDWLGRNIYDCLTPKQLGSAAAQTGRRQVLSETFALTGHNVSHAELKRIYEWHMARGINLLCTHLEGYSNRGIRKRDFPAAIYYQQPWWDDVKLFFDTVSRIGMLIGEGEDTSDTLLLHPLSDAWWIYDGFVENRDAAKKMREISDRFAREMRVLEEKHVQYHLGDETLMERHARVEGRELVVGKMRYRRLVLTKCDMLFENTRRLIEEFRLAGGEIYESVDDVPAENITSQSRLTYLRRAHDDFTMHYFVNTDNESVFADFEGSYLFMDESTGEVREFSGSYRFEPYESIVLLEEKKPRATEKKLEEKEEKLLPITGEWELSDASYNSVTLDRCDYYFDGELVAKCGYVLDILPRINALRRPVSLKQVYRFMIEEMPKGEIFLATETPEIFNIRINGRELIKRDVGDFRDISFRRLPIGELVTLGENTVEFESVISQSEATYEHIDKSWVVETMTNCLSYDIEIEPIYIVGDFGVKILGEITELSPEAYRVKEGIMEDKHSFAIVKRPKTVDVTALDFSGYPQFAGRLVLKKKVELDSRDYKIRPVGRGMNSVRVSVNGKELGNRMFPPYDLSLSDGLVIGENEIEITVLNNLRNMQGPTHLKEGECHVVGRNAFYRESNVFSHPKGVDDTCHDILPRWDDDICLVHFGF